MREHRRGERSGVRVERGGPVLARARRILEERATRRAAGLVLSGMQTDLSRAQRDGARGAQPCTNNVSKYKY